jgi:hypothetical protein
LDKLLEGTTLDVERLDRIHQFVSQKIRYVGLEQGVGDVVPRATELTLERRFGDCKDKTTLFIDLARRAGFEVYPVLTSTKRSDPAKLLIPAASYFNHMVACVVMSAAKEYCVDLTDPYSPYDSLSSFVQGAIRLDLIESPSPPSTLPVTPYDQTKNVNTVKRLMSDGSIEERQTRIYTGQNAASLRSILQPLNQSDKQKWTLERYHESVNNTVDPKFDFDGVNDVRAPITIRSIVQFASGFGPTTELYWEFEPELYIKPPQLKTGNTAHEYPFAGLSYHGETVFQLPKGKRVPYTGPKLNLETPFGALRRYYQVSDNVVRAFTELSLPRANIPLDEIPRFNRFMNYISENAKIWFAMNPG